MWRFYLLHLFPHIHFVFCLYFFTHFIDKHKNEDLTFRYSAGSCQRIEQARHVGGSLACLDKNDEGGPADDEGAGDFLAQRCQGTVQLHQKRAGWRTQKSGEFSMLRRSIGTQSIERQTRRRKNEESVRLLRCYRRHALPVSLKDSSRFLVNLTFIRIDDSV